MKNFFYAVMILAGLGLIAMGQTAHALGPIMVSAHKVTCDPAPTGTTVAGNYIYYSTTTTFTDAQRVQVPDISKTPYDLLVMLAGKANGTYNIAATWYDASGNESGLSNIIPFVLNVLPSPTNEKLTQ